MATGFSTQSDEWPSACMVEEPSKPHSGSWSSVGNSAYSLICVFPRRLGTGVYPSSQMYSSLYFVILASRCFDHRTLDGAGVPATLQPTCRIIKKQFVCHSRRQRMRQK